MTASHSAGENDRQPQPQEARRALRPGLAVVLALLLAAGCAVVAWKAADIYPTYYVAAAAVLSFLGLFAIFGLLAGLARLGAAPAQNAMLDAVADALGEAVCVADLRGRTVLVNAAYSKLAQGAGSRLVGMDMLYSGYPELAEPIYRLAQAARAGRGASEELRLAKGSAAPGARADGPAWIRLTVAPLTIDGTPHALWRAADITAARQRQEQAFADLQFIINYLDRAPAGFFSTDPDGTITYLNATLAEWLGLDLAAAAGGALKLADIAGPEGEKLILGVIAHERATRTETFDIDLRREDGHPVPVRIIHRADYGPDGQLQPSRSLVLGRHALPEGEASGIRLPRLFNYAPIGIAHLGPDGRILNANIAFTTLSPEVKRGVRLADVIAPQHRDALADALAAARIGTTTVPPVQVTFTGSQPRSVKLIVTGSELQGEPGVVEGSTVIYATDTTEHQALEIQLAQSQKMQAIGQLAGGVAHDFNNVLTAIIGFSDLLLARHRASDPAFQDIMNIKQNANRAANLVRQLLAFSRRQTLRPEVLSLTGVISDLGNLLGRLLGEKIELKVSHGRDVGLVKVDVNQFEQVIMNLAVNARDAMPDGGTLTVRTANVLEAESRQISPGLMPPGEYVLCEVADTGIGMTPDVLAKIYEPFFSTKEVGKGTGLGLSTVYGIIQQTGGYILCDSEPGRGTVFRIYLPRMQPQAQAAEEAGEAPAEAPRKDLTGHGTILLVEDEDAVRSFASRALQSRGYKVYEADSGESALRVIAALEQPVDLVLSDVVMPEMDGPTLLRELRKRGIRTKVVFISGYAEDAFERNLEGQEDFAFLPKPFSLKQLAEAVKQAMEQG